MASPAPTTPHVVLFPFMSKGHTIPLLHLAHLFSCRGTTLTIFTTPANSPFIHSSVTHATAKIVEITFPENVPEIPVGIESTDKLPSMALFLPFVHATKLLQPHFEQALHTLPPITCIIYGAFMGWIQLSASKFNIPSLVYYGMSTFSMTISRLSLQDRPHKAVTSDDEPFTLQAFPSLKLCKRDLGEPFNDPDPKGPLFDFIMESARFLAECRGIVLNSFYELEPVYIDYLNREFGLKAWCVGPLCTSSTRVIAPNTKWVQWLDHRQAIQRPVLYVAFGTQAEISSPQLKQIAIGLEQSGVDFLWVIRSKEAELGEGFEERVMERGLVVREWVDQSEILQQESVVGFLSHCGWNSVLESICAEVPILAWPMMAEQRLNAKLIVDELGIGLRIGEGDGVVGWEIVDKMVRELMVGERGKEVRKKVKGLGEAARNAMNEGGHSWESLDMLLDEVCRNS
ncbi:hypothetical protein AAC387_Pa09g0785 [Persea americana]